MSQRYAGTISAYRFLCFLHYLYNVVNKRGFHKYKRKGVLKREVLILRWEREFIQTSRGLFEVFVKGEGEPICVTHLYSEFNASGDYFADAFTDNHTVFLVNLKGAGRSETATNPYEYFMLDSVFDLEAIREELGIKKWTFAGHSTGGMLGCVYGIYASSGLNKLVIVGAAAREYATSSPYCIYHEENPQFAVMQQYIEILKNENLTSVERARIAKKRTELSLYNPDHYENYFSKNISKKMSPLRMNFFAREIMHFDVTRKLYQVSVPALILCGEHDVQCPYQFSEEIAESIPDSTLMLFRYSNHYPFLEEQSEFKKAVKSFL